MNLFVDAARWLASKVIGIALVALVVGAAALVWDWERERRGLQREAASLRLEVETALRDWRDLKAKLLEAEQLLQRLEASRPNPFLSPNDYLAWRAKHQAAEAAAEAARAARDRAKAVCDAGAARLGGLEQKLASFATEWQASVLRHHRAILVAIAAFLFAPAAWSAFWYYGMAPLASRARALVLLPAEVPGGCRAAASGKVVEIEVTPARPLVARMEWVQQYAPGLEKRTRFLFAWSSPLISYASGLREMTEIRQPGIKPCIAGYLRDPNGIIIELLQPLET